MAINFVHRYRMEPKDVAVVRFDNTVPDFVEPELERLYGNTYSSLLQLETYGDLDAGTSTYVVHRSGRIISLLLYRVERNRVRVLNEGLRLDSTELARFCDYVFAAYPSVQLVSFYAIETDVRRLAFPFQRYNCLEDIAMPLPATAEDYLASLGKNTRRNIKRYTDRLKRSFPSFRFDVLEKEAVDEQHVHAIVGFNHARMAEKNKTSAIDEVETQRIVRMAKASGMIGIATIDGRICAGAISYRTGDNYFLYVLAHDPAYDAYWIGVLCCYLTIRECIARGGREFHFLWGRYEYKFTLGAVARDLDRVTVYRSRAHLLLNAATALEAVFAGHVRRSKLWLQEEIREQYGLAPAILQRTLRLLRALRALQRVPAACAGYGARLLCRLARERAALLR
jgi:Acetyltransferase (GNAT) domain